MLLQILSAAFRCDFYKVHIIHKFIFAAKIEELLSLANSKTRLNFGSSSLIFSRQIQIFDFREFLSIIRKLVPNSKARQIQMFDFREFLSIIRRLDQFLKNRNILDIFSTRNFGSCWRFEVYYIST
ncbi:unnamed protein product [Caenorhabditis angaria]|uniref:Uncharacterized protein n=1 Tax=Caenorhabditis angaria TaxID=860376 RepID=A0A9P1N098_9PELO|nr:unnamed protein product [Caenorhabditis angaria]